jgi:hypothetical protein
MPARSQIRPGRRWLPMVALLAVVGFVSTGCFGTWGLRSSYRNYVTSPPAQGQISADEGATWLDGAGSGKGPFQYTVDSSAFDPSTETGYVQFTGGVKTAAHPTPDGSILDLSLWNPRLEIDGDVGTLFVDLNFRSYEGFAPPTLPPLQAQLDMPFATVDLSGVDWTPDSYGAIVITDAPTTGITEAMELIGWDDFYGDPVTLDPFSVTFWPLAAAAPRLAATPRIVVSQTTGLHVGDTVTVWGTGFDPTVNLGTRPPLAGQPAGSYVVFGKFANVWQPSTGAASTTRTVIAQKWGLGQASLSLLDPAGTNPAFVKIDAAGRFEATLPITASTAAGNYGIYSYPGSGAVNAAYELGVPITLAP